MRRQARDSRWSVTPSAQPPDCDPREGWSPKRWVVVGGSGFIGGAVVRHLRNLGVDVKALRTPRLELEPELKDGLAVLARAKALDEVENFARQFRGADVVVNAAGLAQPDASATRWLYGANALLPAVVALAGIRIGVGRVVHLSSAAVQGAREVLDSSVEVQPFSPYSHSKALGERAFLAAAGSARDATRTDLFVIRATSVQGAGRRTTESLRRIALSPLSSVSAPGSQPTVVSSVTRLVDFVYSVGVAHGSSRPILLQPWEGLSVREVLALAGGREPVVLPAWLCRLVLSAGRTVGRLSPRIAGPTRRLELMWLGQRQELYVGTAPSATEIGAILRGEVVAR